MAEPDTFEEPDDVVAEIAAASTGALAESLALRSKAAGRVSSRQKPPPDQPPSEADRFLARQSRMLDLQMEHLHEQRALMLSHLRLRRVNEVLKIGFQALSVVFGLAVVSALGLIAWQAHKSNALVVEPLRTTAELAQRGLDGTVIASRLLDKLRTIENATDSARAPGTFTKDFGDEIKLEIPETGVSIGELQRYLRQWLGHDTYISGEIFRPWTTGGAGAAAADPPLALAVRAGAEPGQTVQGPPSELDSMIETAAENLVAQTQPYRYAVWLARHGRLEAANGALARLALSGSREDRAWAYMYWGGLAAQLDGDFAQAESKERSALALDPRLVMAHDNLAGQEVFLGHDGSAMTQLEEERRHLAAPGAGELAARVRPVLAAWAEARLEEAVGDYRSGAGESLKVGDMADYEGSSRGALLNAAAALALDHDVAAGRRLMTRIGAGPGAVSLADAVSWGSTLTPEIAIDEALEDWSGLRRDLAADEQVATGVTWGGAVLRTYVWPKLALAEARSGQVGEAEALIARTPLDCYLCLRVRAQVAAARGDWRGAYFWIAEATRQAPRLPFAWVEWGKLLAQRGDFPAALEKFDAARRLGPHYAEPLEGAGEVLLRRGDAEGAIDRLRQAEVFAPRWGRLHLMLGSALAAAGRTSDAKAQYSLAQGMDLSSTDLTSLKRDRIL